jgi:hypothetical protein
MSTDRKLAMARGVIEEIKPLLRGWGPEVQGAVLAELAALWIAGHRPDFRQQVFDVWTATVQSLVPIAERELFGDKGWRDPTA